MILVSWSETVTELAAEILAQAKRFAENHLASDMPARITRVDSPEMPGHLTFLVEQTGEPILLIVVDSDHVLEEASKLTARPGLILEGIRRAARMVYIDAPLDEHLRAALARAC